MKLDGQNRLQSDWTTCVGQSVSLRPDRHLLRPHNRRGGRDLHADIFCGQG